MSKITTTPAAFKAWVLKNFGYAPGYARVILQQMRNRPGSTGFSKAIEAKV